MIGATDLKSKGLGITHSRLLIEQEEMEWEFFEDLKAIISNKLKIEVF